MRDHTATAPKGRSQLWKKKKKSTFLREEEEQGEGEHENPGNSAWQKTGGGEPSGGVRFLGG